MSARTPLEPHDAVHPATFDGPLALQHEPELHEELGRGCEVVNHDADVLHPLDSHVFDSKEPDSGRGARRVHSDCTGGSFFDETPQQDSACEPCEPAKETMGIERAKVRPLLTS
jgi:hypothetical protein